MAGWEKVTEVCVLEYFGSTFDDILLFQLHLRV